MRRPTSLDRLPILDALHAECGCLFCELEADDELRVVEDYLRESVMDPEHRADIETNGLCRGHVHLLLGGGDVLGAAITVGAMLGTAVRAGLGDEAPSDVGVRGSRLRGLGLGALAPQGAAAARAQRQGRDCVFCRTLEGRARRRNDTFMRLYAENAEFRAEFAASRALCVPHGRQLVASASKARTLRPELRAALAADANAILKATAAELGAKLDWFIQKHDYRYHDSDWNGSQNAPYEAAQFLVGRAGTRPCTSGHEE